MYNLISARTLYFIHMHTLTLTRSHSHRIVYSAIPLVTDSGDFLFIMADPAAWLTILLASVVALLPRLIVRLGVHITAVFPVGP
eukprot:m.67569 g.67569  ORF g.67569 m.67569 type:complete len:84 (-) comp12715_c1_seq2:47-298(-)